MPTSKPRYLFLATQSVDDRLGDVFSFIWASYAGLRELWWQVRGFQNQFPNLHIKEIESKFLSGLPLPGGIDFQHLFLRTAWQAHEQEFAKWLLFEACTLYEGWVEKVSFDVFPSQTSEKNSKALQFPAGTNRGGNATGYPTAIAEANSTNSPLMVAEFFPGLKASALNCWPTIDAHLTAYRYFKECRNALIHSEGTVTTDVLAWQARVTAAQGMQPSPFRHQFSLPTQTQGSKIVLHLKDCVLLTTIVRRLICTFDAALSVAMASERLLEKRLRSLVATGPKWLSLPKDRPKREQRVHRMLSASRIPEPVNFGNVMLWMESKGIITP